MARKFIVTGTDRDGTTGGSRAYDTLREARDAYRNLDPHNRRCEMIKEYDQTDIHQHPTFHGDNNA